MSPDPVTALSKSISTPVATMTLVTVDSTYQAKEIVRTVTQQLKKRPWAQISMPCTGEQAGALIKDAREITAGWQPQTGVLFLLDQTPPNRPSGEGVKFWRAMNLQRETWSALNCHLVFLLTPQNQVQLLTIADHLASWIPIKLDARQPQGVWRFQELQFSAFSNFVGRSRGEARQRLEELERGLADALASGAEIGPVALLRRYHLPMLETALAANDLGRADTIRTTIDSENVPDADKPRWWQAVCQTLLQLYRLEEAEAETKRRLKWAEQSGNAKEEGAARATLGEILYAKGDFGKALTQFKRALAIDEAIYGTTHPNVATVVNHLGLVVQALGDFEGARTRFEQALMIDEAAHGPNHPNVARDANNLGLTLLALGDLDGASSCFERALTILHAHGELTDPNVATILNNLGGIRMDMGDLAGAQAYFEQALKIDEAAHGPMHPNVARDANNLGSAHRDMGDFKQARTYYQQAVKIFEAAYGEDHPNVAAPMNNLGLVADHDGNTAAARAYYKRALSILRASLSDNHPQTMAVAENLAALDE